MIHTTIRLNAHDGIAFNSPASYTESAPPPQVPEPEQTALEPAEPHFDHQEDLE